MLFPLISGTLPSLRDKLNREATEGAMLAAVALSILDNISSGHRILMHPERKHVTDLVFIAKQIFRNTIYQDMEWTEIIIVKRSTGFVNARLEKYAQKLCLSIFVWAILELVCGVGMEVARCSI